MWCAEEQLRPQARLRTIGIWIGEISQGFERLLASRVLRVQQSVHCCHHTNQYTLPFSRQLPISTPPPLSLPLSTPLPPLPISTPPPPLPISTPLNSTSCVPSVSSREMANQVATANQVSAMIKATARIKAEDTTANEATARR